MKLLTETPEQYINWCIKQINDQKYLIAEFREAYENHKDKTGCRELEPSTKCQSCELFLEVIIDQGRLLDLHNERYQKAKRGIYD